MITVHDVPATLNVVEITHWTGVIHMEEDAHVEAYHLLFDDIRRAALSPRRSIGLIQQVMEDAGPEEGTSPGRPPRK